MEFTARTSFQNAKNRLEASSGASCRQGIDLKADYLKWVSLQLAELDDVKGELGKTLKELSPSFDDNPDLVRKFVLAENKLSARLGTLKAALEYLESAISRDEPVDTLEFGIVAGLVR